MRDEKTPAVYIVASRYRGTLYVGVTSALWNRISAHKARAFDGFTKKYAATALVWYEHHSTMDAAIKREKQLKKWNRAWKIRIIEELNPEWHDLHDHIDPSRLATMAEAGPPPSQG